jgi:predicted ABC-type ATPase
VSPSRRGGSPGGSQGGRRRAPARIIVIAGVNGAGKSSVVGATIREAGGRYYNPDEAARTLRVVDPSLSVAEANARAWEEGRAGLERAIARHEDFTFETTLGGATIAGLLARALDEGLAVVVRYVGLDTPERHIARVQARVAQGGHDIPDTKVRERYVRSREHLVALLPRLTDLAVYDNSAERDPARGEAPEPMLLLRTAAGRITFLAQQADIPAWARAVVAAAIRSHQARPDAP